MIQEFRVKNFMSIRDEQTLSFEATKDTTSLEYLTYEVKPNLRLLKMAVLYGANASGKTNILIALESLWRMLFAPMLDKNRQILYEPFALDKDKPTIFAIQFYIDSVKYEYKVAFNDSYVLNEIFSFAPNGIMSTFYVREFVNESVAPKIKFGDLLQLSAKAKRAFIDNTLNNHTVLSTYAKISVDAKPFNVVHTWIKKYVHEEDEDLSILDIAENILSNDIKKKFVLTALCKADFNISNLEIKEIPNEIPTEIKERIKNDDSIPDSIKTDLLKEKKMDLEFTHHTNDGDFALSVRLESNGTRKYIPLLERLYNMTIENHIYIFDEIERGIHYDLLLHYLSLFMMNTNASQIIFTTHDQMLLDEEFVRRDMVWFTEKSNDTGATELYSAAEFGLHKNLSLYKAYKSGRLGAKPSLGSIFIEQ
ncbi:ATP-binding protein [Paludibacter sp.]|uniref:AAA family ATPase n=1 Tax=Paludibacter sp. TaxID=1898105 RepID=UPI001352283C|nr:ATP-binding protein [Paludibacter sp.]MTK53203.1 ATP-binding protein [Paludibacter sp.]